MADTSLRRAAAIGCGVIGAGWIARLRLNGVDVTASDPSPAAGRIIDAVHDNALMAWRELDLEPAPESIGSLTVCGSIDEAVADAQLVVESVPERLDVKHATLTQIDSAAPADAVIASSTSGFRPTVLAEPLGRPERLIVGHPFNPVYLLPLVEVVAGERTAAQAVDRAIDWYGSLGMHPLRVRAEIDAHIADRLMEAVWREALWLVNDGVATTEEIDDAIRYGFGLRWAQMGLFETYRIAGGEGGMRHFIGQFGECLTWPWTKLMDVPDLDDRLIDTIATQSDEQSGHLDVRELERIRDRNVAAMLLALERNAWGAGRTIAAMRERAE
ncbi:3-hydroxyacyl-CoA dehydrogenase NAD-binding domain-containing protein [Ilumatobacter sp.]|uniref:3-hydroxyacyl-CoA dehydrogenase NAD-binding domain-containing protein n=1 Tax=Ilumatobacter sp. TaxID=1967498 RepID=UPI003AF5F4E8